MNQEIQHITEDFQIFLTYLKTQKEISLTKDGAKLKSKELFLMNETVHNQALWVTEKTTQKRFTLFNMFYWIMVYGKLAKRKKNPKGENIFELDAKRVEDFLLLNTSEQYCFLLKTIWCDMNWERLYDERSLYYLDDGVESLKKLPAEKKYLIRDRRFIADNLRAMQTPYTEIFAYMGWYKIEPVTLLKKYDAYELPYTSLTVTSLGKAIGKIFEKERLFSSWNKYLDYFEVDEDTTLITDENFIIPFKPIFDEPIENLLLLPPHEFVGGTYTFKLVIDKSIYRVIEIDGEDTLEDLHEIIQKALKFGNDHLFSFTIDDDEILGNPWGDSSDGWSNYLAHDTTIGDLEMYIGQVIDYRFDFGDNWHFDLILKNIDTSAKPLKSAKIIESVGKAPKQYREW